MSKKKWIATSSGSLIWVSKIRHLLQDSLHHLEKCPNKKGLFWYAKYYILHPHDKRKWACFITLLPLFMHCKVPFLAAVFTSQLSSFHFKIYIFPINLQSTNKISISQLIFLHLILKPQRLLTSHIVVTSDINNRMVQNFGILDWNLVFLKNPSQILWTNCFFFFSNFLHEMVSFTHQEFVQGTCYRIWRLTDQVKEHVKRVFEHLVNGVKHYVSTRTPFIHDLCVFIH